MRACTSWGTRGLPGPGLRTAAVLLALAAGGGGGLQAATEDLHEALEKAGRSLDKAAGATRGSDPGKVSLLLIRADGHLERFETASGLVTLTAAETAAREAAERGELGAAATEVRRARGPLPRLSAYIVSRAAEEASRAALRAAEEGDAAALGAALDRFHDAALADVLLERLRDARAGIAAGRAAMVRGDMTAGLAAIDSARAGLDGVRHAAALSQATFALAASADLLQAGAILGARDLARRASRDLRLAADTAPDSRKAAVVSAQQAAYQLWDRMKRLGDVDPAAVRDAAERVEAIRQEQRG